MYWGELQIFGKTGVIHWSSRFSQFCRNLMNHTLIFIFLLVTDKSLASFYWLTSEVMIHTELQSKRQSRWQLWISLLVHEALLMKRQTTSPGKEAWSGSTLSLCRLTMVVYFDVGTQGRLSSKEKEPGKPPPRQPCMTRRSYQPSFFEQRPAATLTLPIPIDDFHKFFGSGKNVPVTSLEDVDLPSVCRDALNQCHQHLTYEDVDRLLIYVDGSSDPKHRHHHPAWVEEEGTEDTWAFVVLGEKYIDETSSHFVFLGWSAQCVVHDPKAKCFAGAPRIGSDVRTLAAQSGAQLTDMLLLWLDLCRSLCWRTLWQHLTIHLTPQPSGSLSVPQLRPWTRLTIAPPCPWTLRYRVEWTGRLPSQTSRPSCALWSQTRPWLDSVEGPPPTLVGALQCGQAWLTTTHYSWIWCWATGTTRPCCHWRSADVSCPLHRWIPNRTVWYHP